MNAVLLKTKDYGESGLNLQRLVDAPEDKMLLVGPAGVKSITSLETVSLDDSAVVLLNRDSAASYANLLTPLLPGGIRLFIHGDSDSGPAYFETVSSAVISTCGNYLSEAELSVVVERTVGFTLSGAVEFQLPFLNVLRKYATSDSTVRSMARLDCERERLADVWRHLRIGYLLVPLMLQHARLQLLLSSSEEVTASCKMSAFKGVTDFMKRNAPRAFEKPEAQELFRKGNPLHGPATRLAEAMESFATRAADPSCAEFVKEAKNRESIDAFMKAVCEVVSKHTPRD